MRARCIVPLLGVMLLVINVPSAGLERGAASLAPPNARAVAPASVPGQLILGFRSETSVATRAALVAAHGGRTIATLDSIDALVVAVPAARPLGLVARDFAAEPAIRYAEPHHLYQVAGTPNDPRYSANELWGLRTIAAPTAWATTTGNRDVIVGVVDSGIDAAHPDLAANLWTAPAGWTVASCTPGTHGYSSLAGQTDCTPDEGPPGSLARGHGTHVAGTIGAVGDNGVGVVGVNWQVRLMALRCANPDDGSVRAADAIKVIEYAVAARQAGENLRVLNLNWTATTFSQGLLDVINLAGAAGILIVAAAGDTIAGDSDNDQVPYYPASYAAAPHNAANVIAVTATDRNDVKDGSANHGRTSVHLAAPGQNILSTVPGGYLSYTGTSMAAAHVSGAAALLLAHTNTLTSAELRGRILACGDPISSLGQKTTTGRRLNVARAIANIDCAYALTVIQETGGYIVASPAASQYPSGATVTLTAAPQEGYRFDGWSVDGAPLVAGNPLTMTMLTNHQVTARFSLQRFSIMLDVDYISRGGASADPVGPTYEYDEPVTLTAIPLPGFLFLKWTANIPVAETSNPLVITMRGDVRVQAHFTPLASPMPSASPAPSPSARPLYALDLVATEGGVIGASVPGPYPAGSRVALAAVPQEGYRFIGWTIDGTPAGAANPFPLAMNAPHTVRATFVRAYLLTLSTTAGGGVAVDSPGWSGGSPYPTGTALTLTAATGGNGVFTGWTIDGRFVGWRTPLALTMDAPHIVVANFSSRPRFGDLPPGPPPYEAISQLAARGIVRGYDNGDFGPADQTLRAQMAALIVRAMGWEAEAPATPFTDRCLPEDPPNCVDDGLWRDVGILAARDVARGYGDGTYGARDPVLHIQAVAFIARAMVRAGHWTMQPDDAALYPHVPAASGHREDLATYAHYAGMIPGTTSTAAWPAWERPATRGWFALALWQALDSRFNGPPAP